jgi:hypothetical protein
MLRSIKKVIASVMFEEFDPANPICLNTVKANSSWIFPQLLAKANEDFILKKTPEGLISPSESLKATQAAGIDVTWWAGVFKMINVPRSEVLKETPTKVPEFSVLTPIIMSAFKKFRGINYSDWDLEDTKIVHFMGKDLYDWYIHRKAFTAHKSELLAEIRATIEDTKVYKSIHKSPNEIMTPVPRPVRAMLLQCWVAHPSYRSKYQILDLNNLDNMPEPFESTEIITRQDYDLPWG